jgi:hypothetical protein
MGQEMNLGQDKFHLCKTRGDLELRKASCGMSCNATASQKCPGIGVPGCCGPRCRVEPSGRTVENVYEEQCRTSDFFPSPFHPDRSPL